MAEYYNLLAKLQKEIDDNKTTSMAEYRPAVPKEIRRFLGRLCMLHQVPFQYLVPDGRLVAYKPIEVTLQGGTKVTQQCGALRFFWLDPVWVQALLSGALSIGEQGDSDYLLKQAMEGTYGAEDFSEETARRVKSYLGNSDYEGNTYSPEELQTTILAGMRKKGIQIKLLGDPPEHNKARQKWRYTGFLLRSVLSTIKGVEVTAMGVEAFESKDAPKTIPVIRMEKIADDTFFCLCEGIVKEVVIKQPSENLYFSINGKGGNYIKQVKGENMPVPMRNGDKRVLNIEALAGELKTRTQEAETSAIVAKYMLSMPIKYTIGVNWKN